MPIAILRFDRVQNFLRHCLVSGFSDRNRTIVFLETRKKLITYEQQKDDLVVKAALLL
jgi:hypothetical protein